MKAMNKMEEKVLEMIAEGKHLHGYAREIWIEMLLREEEKKNAAEAELAEKAR